MSVNIFRVFCQNEFHELPTSESLGMLVKYARALSQISSIIMSGRRAWAPASSSSTLGDSDAFKVLRTTVNQYLFIQCPLSLKISTIKSPTIRIKEKWPKAQIQPHRVWGMKGWWSQRWMKKSKDVSNR